MTLRQAAAHLHFGADVIGHNTEHHSKCESPQQKHGVQQNTGNEIALLQQIDTCIRVQTLCWLQTAQSKELLRMASNTMCFVDSAVMADMKVPTGS